MRPLWMANAVSESLLMPVPVFARTAAQPVAGFVPGCSGNVEPGDPWSAKAGEAAVAKRARAAAPAIRRLFMVTPVSSSRGHSTSVE
jgi:hypothetical protein